MSKVMLAIGNAEIESMVETIEDIEIIENERDMNILKDVLSFEPADFIIMNTLLSREKAIDLAREAQKTNSKVIAIIESFEDKKLIATLAGFDVNAFLLPGETSKIKKLMKEYPPVFDFSRLQQITPQSAGKQKTMTPDAGVRFGGTVSIAVSSASAGAGSTTTAITVAETIAKCGFGVICLALDGLNALSHLDPKTHKAHYVAATTTEEQEQLGLMLQGFYADNRIQFIVLDFGNLFQIGSDGTILKKVNQEAMSEYLRCSYKITMGFSDPWHICKLKFYLNNGIFTDEISTGSHFFVLSGPDTETAIKRYSEFTIFKRDDMKEIMEDFLYLIGVCE